MRLFKYMVLIMSFNVSAAAIDIKFLKREQDIKAILKVQQAWSIAEDPKRISIQPKAICFQADINKYLSQNNANQKRIYGCIFSDQMAMNAALLRAGLFVHTNMGMATDEQLFNSKLMTAVGGHDFDGRELVKYEEQANIQTNSAIEHQQMKAIEKEFNKKIIKPIIEKNHDNFIFFAIINTKKFKANLTHELLHAQYYNDQRIAQILLEIWNNQVSVEDKALITESLAKGGYDIAQQELLLREFYSYFLQYNASTYLEEIKVLKPIGPLADKYAVIIKQKFLSLGIPIIMLSE